MEPNKEILLIEDNPGDAGLIAAFLQEPGFPSINHIWVDRLDQGLKRLTQGNIDLVLTDLNLPDSTGIDTFTQIQKSYPRIPIVLLTGLDDRDLALAALHAGAQDYLVKDEIDAGLLHRSIRYALERHNIILQLRQANREVLARQNEVIEEERSKILLQMTGATAHELNQPLMILLNSIQMMEQLKHDPKNLKLNMHRIMQAGQRIANSIKKIQTIRRPETITHLEEKAGIINLNQRIRILCIEALSDDYHNLETAFEGLKQVVLTRAKNIGAANEILSTQHFDIIFVNSSLPDGNGLEFIKQRKKIGIDTPVVIISSRHDELLFSRAIRAGATGFLVNDHISVTSLTNTVNTVLDKHRLTTELCRLRKRQSIMSIRDELTGLMNQHFYTETLGRELAKTQRNKRPIALAAIQIENLATVIDYYGYAQADVAIKTVSDLIQASVRICDLVCRNTFSKFLVLLPDTDRYRAKFPCDRIERGIEEFNKCEDHLPFDLSISISMLDPDSAFKSILKEYGPLRQGQKHEPRPVGLNFDPGERMAIIDS